EVGRNQDDAVERHVVPRQQIEGHAAGANAAVALPQDELRAGPALEIAEIAHDEVGDGLDVVVDAPEVLAFRLADRARETGADRVDHHQVRAIEEAELIVDEL